MRVAHLQLVAVFALLTELSLAQRHDIDKRCAPSAVIDPPTMTRGDRSTFQTVSMDDPAKSKLKDCIELCCGDWLCQSFAYSPANVSISSSSPSCALKDDIEKVVEKNSSTPLSVITGARSFLPSIPPTVANSTAIKPGSVTFADRLYPGIDGDEFPTTWDDDGFQYTGAGDNHQPGQTHGSPLSFFRVKGDPTDTSYPGDAFEEMSYKPVTDLKLCPTSKDGVPNLKSSSVLSMGSVIYWAVSCFNYGDDDVFNRQRYGPGWIITSVDKGKTW
jgi:hypothetical protein